MTDCTTIGYYLHHLHELLKINEDKDDKRDKQQLPVEFDFQLYGNKIIQAFEKKNKEYSVKDIYKPPSANQVLHLNTHEHVANIMTVTLK